MQDSNKNVAEITKKLGLPKIPQPTEISPESQSFLKPIVLDPKSPYYSETGIPKTTGDYQQRVKNTFDIKPPAWYKVPFRKSPIFIGAAILFGTTVAVFFSNAAIVYGKERKVGELLKERDRLRGILKEYFQKN
ncbi:hypothetical protein HDV06_002587 [Boothiomyces sp. JEL0866]|nr:hypothetical protein HDV06_002587 [Boothiomyces sp. JEL0866]